LVNIYQGLVRSILEYATEIWSEGDWNEAEDIQHMMIKRILRLDHRASRSVLRGELGLLTTKSRRDILRLRYWYKLHVMDENRLLKKVYVQQKAEHDHRTVLPNSCGRTNIVYRSEPQINKEGLMLYEVDEILKKRIVNDELQENKSDSESVEYLVSWVGYKLSEATWEPVVNLKLSKQKIKIFEKKQCQLQVQQQQQNVSLPDPLSVSSNYSNDVVNSAGQSATLTIGGDQTIAALPSVIMKEVLIKVKSTPKRDHMTNNNWCDYTYELMKELDLLPAWEGALSTLLESGEIQNEKSKEKAWTKLVEQRLLIREKKEWRNEMLCSTGANKGQLNRRLVNYNQIKSSFEMEPYLNDVDETQKEREGKQLLTRLRAGTLKLHIETGRFRRPLTKEEMNVRKLVLGDGQKQLWANTSLSDRLCEVCKKIKSKRSMLHVSDGSLSNLGISNPSDAHLDQSRASSNDMSVSLTTLTNSSGPCSSSPAGVTVDDGIVVEDEKHFLLDCQGYQEIRETFGENINQLGYRWLSMTESERFETIFQPVDGVTETGRTMARKVRRLVKEYVCNIWHKRMEIIKPVSSNQEINIISVGKKHTHTIFSSLMNKANFAAA